MAVDGGEDLGGGVVEADEADGGFGQAESGEGFSVDDGVGNSDGKGGFSGFGETGEEDKGVFDEEGFGSVGAGVGAEVLRFDLLELVGGGAVGSVGVAGEGEFLGLEFVVVVVFDHHLLGDAFGGLSTRLVFSFGF